MRIHEGRVYWSLGSIVEVITYDDTHDPNRYRARCLTAGTFPLVQVLDNPRYPDPVQVKPVASSVVIGREIAESAEAEWDAVENGREAYGQFVIVGRRKGYVRVVRREDDEMVREGLASIEAAAAWIDCNACAECGCLVTDAAGPGCTQRHLGASKDFAF